MLHLFFGHDERIAAGTHAFLQSVLEHASETICLQPITRKNTGEIPEGSNAFTLRRFLVPHMMGFRGWALFVDGSDMMCRSDICEIQKHIDFRSAVQVVRHRYSTKHPRKFVGTSMETDNDNYPRKQWASVMLIHCGHGAWKTVTPEYVRSVDPLHLLQLRFIPQDRIGDLPVEWNWLADEQGHNDAAKLVHFTAGIPAITAYKESPMSGEWRGYMSRACLVAASRPVNG